jgi:transcriptional regulator with XRE-family HTH domain
VNDGFWYYHAMILGDRLKELRTAQGLSQGDIQERAGLLRSYVSRVENGHSIPSTDTLEKWTNALRTPLYQLFYNSLSNATPDESDFPRHKADQQFRNFAVALGKMNKRDRDILFVIARHMATNKFQKH